MVLVLLCLKMRYQGIETIGLKGHHFVGQCFCRKGKMISFYKASQYVPSD